MPTRDSAVHKLYFALFAFLAIGLCTEVAMGQPSTAPAVKLEVPVLPEAEKYLELLTAPAYLALALENNGIRPSLSSGVTIVDRRTFSIKAGTVKFIERKGNVFVYEGRASVSLGIAEAGLTVPVEVDTSSIRNGTLIVRAYSALSSILPKALIDRVEFKLRALADLQSQRKVLAYLDRLSREHGGKLQGSDSMEEAIAFEAYNQASQPRVAPATTGDRGQAEPLADQAMLLITVAIWLIAFPAFLLFIRARRKLRQSV